MNTFASLLKHRKGKPPSETQEKARQDFPRTVSKSRLKLRKPGEPIPSSGRRFILGIATYSADELGLLDELEETLENGDAERADVEVFDVLGCEQMADFEKFIPGIGGVSCTPIVGVISSGKLIDQATGLPDVQKTLRRFNVLNH